MTVKIFGAKPDAWSFGRDIAVIILGVLIALGFDSWVTEREDRTLEVQYLSRLARDLRGDSLLLAEYRTSAEAGERAALELLALLVRSPAVTPDTVIARYFGDATRDAYLTPNSPTIEELQSTGHLRVITGSTTRDAVLTYYTQVTVFQRKLETIMRRGKDPLGEVGWDIRAFDPARVFALLRQADSTRDTSTEGLLQRFQSHPDAERATYRAITYNQTLQLLLSDWERSLASVMARVVAEQTM